MTFANIKQREKETEAQKYFIVYSILFSVLLHIGLLALNISKLWLKDPQVKYQPIEVQIMEIPAQKLVQTIENNQNKIKDKSSIGGNNQGGGQLNLKSSFVVPQISTVAEPQPSKITDQTKIVSNKIQIKNIHDDKIYQPNLVRKPKIYHQFKTVAEKTPTIKNNHNNDNIYKPSSIPQEIQDNLVQNSQKLIDEIPKNEPNLIRDINPKYPESLDSTIQPSVTSSTVVTTPTSSPELTQSLPTSVDKIGDKTLSNPLNKNSGNGVGSGVGNGVGSGVGSGVGNGVGNGVGDEKGDNSTINTTPKPEPVINSRLDRTDCLICDIKYPEIARRRGIEGKTEVAIDIDKNGNVTNVQLIKSSGDRSLDQAAQTSALNWKLKSSGVERQGIRALINFTMAR